jgi:hypothetical protein
VRHTCASSSQNTQLADEPFIFFEQTFPPHSLSCLHAFGGGPAGSVGAITAVRDAQMPSGRCSSLMHRWSRPHSMSVTQRGELSSFDGSSPGAACAHANRTMAARTRRSGRRRIGLSVAHLDRRTPRAGVSFTSRSLGTGFSPFLRRLAEQNANRRDERLNRHVAIDHALNAETNSETEKRRRRNAAR